MADTNLENRRISIIRFFGRRRSANLAGTTEEVAFQAPMTAFLGLHWVVTGMKEVIGNQHNFFLIS